MSRNCLMTIFSAGVRALRPSACLFSMLGSLPIIITVLFGACAVSNNTDPTNSSPKSSFTYSPTFPTPGQAIQFTDTSAGTPTSWLWDLGDGSTSTMQNPSHTYTTAGSKSVSLTAANSAGSNSTSKTISVISASSIIINHNTIRLASIPTEAITQAKQTLHIAYGHTSHGSQLIDGMSGLWVWKGAFYAWNNGGTGGALDIRDYTGGPNTSFGYLNIAWDLGNPNRTAWATATRTYLNQNPTVNVIIWAWCGQVDGTEADINLYLSLMDQLEREYPNVKFVYMTGHTDGAALTGNVPRRNQQIRDYCIANNKILYDFADIESYDPDGVYYGDKLVTETNDYDSNGDGIRDRNWAIDWQNAHPGEWYNCYSAHSYPLNANLKAYAAWWLWARLAGWDGK